jgi:hypothetical protein
MVLALGYAMSLTALCGGTVPAHADPPAPELTVAPEQGQPGAPFKATISGFGVCLGTNANIRVVDRPYTMSLQFDQSELRPTSAVNADDGSVVADIAVPGDATAGRHTVRAQCSDGTSIIATATATFTVVPAEKPTLTLQPDKGRSGSQMTASGTGFACDAEGVQVLWDGKKPLADAPSGTFTVQPTVPSDAFTGNHTVVASCRNDPDITDQQSFTVTSTVTNPPPEPAALALQPTSGHAGEQVRASGDRFLCANHSRTVELAWDETQLASPALDASGHFDASFSVPATAEANGHTVRAACSDTSAAAVAEFTVIAVNGSVVPPTPVAGGHTSSPSPELWWVIVLVVAAVAVLVAYLRWGRPRPPKPPAPRVQAVSRLSGPPLVTTRETPADGEATHAIRLQALSGVNSVTIREVDDDHTRPD